MEEEKHTQIPTIKKAVTYIVDENGVEVEADLITQIKEPDSTPAYTEVSAGRDLKSV